MNNNNKLYKSDLRLALAFLFGTSALGAVFAADNSLAASFSIAGVGWISAGFMLRTVDTWRNKSDNDNKNEKVNIGHNL